MERPSFSYELFMNDSSICSDYINELNIINFIILRMQFQNLSGVILELIILIFN